MTSSAGRHGPMSMESAYYSQSRFYQEPTMAGCTMANATAALQWNDGSRAHRLAREQRGTWIGHRRISGVPSWGGGSRSLHGAYSQSGGWRR